MTPKNEVRLWIRTWDNDGKCTYHNYTVPLDGEMSVLNALEYVHEHLDPGVSYRSSCRRGVCGGCAMTIDGKRRLACETPIKEGMKIDPFDEARGG